MASTPRRSSRLKAKQEDKQAKEDTLRSKRRNMFESDSSCDEKQQHESGSEGKEMDDDVLNLSVTATPSRTLIKTNNFTKVHNSYNKDYGIDTYEPDFIDDTEFLRHTPLKRPRKSSRHHSGNKHTTSPSPKKARESKRKARGYQLSSESDSASSSSSNRRDSSRKSPNIKTPRRNVRVKRTIRVSSDESDKERITTSPKLSKTLKNPSTSTDTNTPLRTTGESNDEGRNSEYEELNLSLSAKRRRVKSNAGLSSNSSEEGSSNQSVGCVERVKRKRKRLLREFESDNEISDIVKEQSATVRQRSSRAEKLRQQKEKKNKRVLQKLQAERAGRSTKASSSEDKSSVSDGEAEMFGTIKGDDPVNYYSNNSPLSLAEQILFPPNDIESSDEEDSDWIVSDDDSELMNINELDLMNIQKPLCYHFESKSCETREAILKTENSSLTSDVKQDSITSKTRLSGLLLHEAVNGEEPVSRLKELLPKMEGKLDTVDNHGYTPLMCAAVRGRSEVMELLISAGASVNCKDSSQTTPLHLAAASGWVECVELLIKHGHPVECRDEQGWPPLLYAHFIECEECVLALMRAGPQQLSVLSELLRKAPSDRTDGRKKTIKVVRSLLISLAHHETYYSIFNDFIRDNPAVLEDDGFGFMKHCMALLSFENKQAWLKMKLKKLSVYAQSTSTLLSLRDLPRDDFLLHVLQHLQNLLPSHCWLAPLMVTFKGEHGICIGPRREFWSCLSRSLAEGKERLFSLSDEGQLCLQPCFVFSKYFYTVMNPQLLQTHTQHLQLVGSLLAYALFHGDTVGVCLTEPLLKQLVGLTLNHPEDLESVDRSLYYNYAENLNDDEIDDLELAFVITMFCPWNEQTVDIPLRENGRSTQLTKENKEEYVKSMSEFKLENSVRQELDAFLSGFWRVIPKRCLEVFTPNELSLLLSGVPTIDVDDWYKNTQYHGFSPNDDIIVWFWRLIRSLKEEEKALLLKFATGSPRVPAGGFNSLLGLGGFTKFTISLIPGKDKIPQASTCFNMLNLTDYSHEQELRDKILIAIRYGCEGFEFA